MSESRCSFRLAGRPDRTGQIRLFALNQNRLVGLEPNVQLTARPSGLRWERDHPELETKCLGEVVRFRLVNVSCSTTRPLDRITTSVQIA